MQLSARVDMKSMEQKAAKHVIEGFTRTITSTAMDQQPLATVVRVLMAWQQNLQPQYLQAIVAFVSLHTLISNLFIKAMQHIRCTAYLTFIYAFRNLSFTR